VVEVNVDVRVDEGDDVGILELLFEDRVDAFDIRAHPA